MNPQVKKQWVARTRSGDFKQGYGQLTDGIRHCIFGILCEIAVEEGIVVKDTKYYGDNYLSPPKEVWDWAGFDWNQEYSQKLLVYSTLNDAGVPFSIIADKIEKEL